MTRIGPPQHGQAGISAFVSRRLSPFLVRRIEYGSIEPFPYF
jgi:hypothetical protein